MPSAPAYDSARLKRERQESLQREMRERGIGAALLGDGMNVRYVLDVGIPGGRVFVPPDGEVVALVRPRDMRYVQLHHSDVRQTWHHRTDTWRPEYQEKLARFVDGIAGLLAEHGATDTPLAVDDMDPGSLLALARSGVEIVDALPIIERARAVKTQDEVAVYRALGDQYAQIFRQFREAVRPGVTEKQLEAMVIAAWPEVGGDDILQINVCAGENMNPWRRWATDRPLREGEFVGIDFHGRGGAGLLGDTSRTYLVGDRPSAEQRDLYWLAYDYVQRTADAFRAGRSYADVVELIPPVPERYQAQQDNYHVAHAVSMLPSGYPKIDRLRDPDDDVLKSGQVLSIECYFGEMGSDLAVKLEEMILVRDGPPEFISGEVPYEDRILG